MLLNACLAFIMFGIALDLKPQHFLALLKTPKPILVGLSSQFLLLPALTFVLVLVSEPTPSIAMGMILVAACPGGNVSNFYSALAKGNVALSVSLTAISSSLALVMTPLNFAFWSSLYQPTSTLIQQINLNIMNVVITILMIIIIPLIAGMIFSNKYPSTTRIINGPIRKLSILIFASFVFFALSANFDHLVNYLYQIFFVVLIHNMIAISTGYGTGLVANLNFENRKSIAIETGIQNSGLALVLIFEYFNGLGGMAIIAAWWGVWHLISGAFLAWVWSGKRLKPGLSQSN